MPDDAAMQMETRRKQLQFRANHRGIKEMDVLLGGFATARIAALNETELADFESLLQYADHDLLGWFCGEPGVPAVLQNSLFEAILAHQANSVANKIA